MSPAAPSIADYGLIGDMRTAALVGRHGGIDWCCLPRFDSGSVFAALLDSQRGGTWLVQPSVPFEASQRYLTGTNILETSFRTGSGEVALTDFMPVAPEGGPASRHPEIHRRIRGVHGEVAMRMRFMPRFEYASRATRIEVLRAGIFASDRTDQVVTLSSARPFEWRVEQGAADADFMLPAGDTRWLVLRYDDDDIHPVDRYESAAKLETTTALLAALELPCPLRGPLAGRGGALGADPEAAHPRRERRHHRRPHDLTARGHRGVAQLGLSLRLAPGCGLHALGAGECGARRGGGRVHALPASGLPPRRRRTLADHVRGGWTARSDRTPA